MKREIKFRAYIRDEGRLLNVNLIDFDDEYVRVWDEYGENEEEWFLKDCELIQYTGLKDMNGVDIYECDVVRFDTNVQILESEVTYYHGMFTIKKYGEKIPLFTALKVIGNKFENPELLGVEE
ncbi:hypothetical protein LTWDN19_00770 [Latilactobacillus curvatus]|uniref:YopX protein domain-containing protein n=1 Tax=Latilactobacillus curvatus TaxID=28038 RepID=A0ABM7QR31_LATCU|nr:YopX family protein [Latilactobacillus curvatus]BCX29510.1 hypothetical protein LTWDN19_00770 [Latilactobacillus curvatus]